MLCDGRGQRAAVFEKVVFALIDRHARRADAQGEAQLVAHDFDFVGAGGALGRGGTHGELADCSVTDQAGNVDPALFLEALEILPKGGPAPVHAGLKRLARNRFDAHQSADQIAAVFGFAGRQRQRTVAGDHRRDAMPAR